MCELVGIPHHYFSSRFILMEPVYVACVRVCLYPVCVYSWFLVLDV